MLNWQLICSRSSKISFSAPTPNLVNVILNKMYPQMVYWYIYKGSTLISLTLFSQGGGRISSPPRFFWSPINKNWARLLKIGDFSNNDYIHVVLKFFLSMYSSFWGWWIFYSKDNPCEKRWRPPCGYSIRKIVSWQSADNL